MQITGKGTSTRTVRAAQCFREGDDIMCCCSGGSFRASNPAALRLSALEPAGMTRLAIVAYQPGATSCTIIDEDALAALIDGQLSQVVAAEEAAC